MKTNNATITISRNSNNEFTVTIRDNKSHIQFVKTRMSPHDFAMALSGLAEVECEAEYRMLECVGKTKITETRSVECPIKFKREDQSKWLAENCQEEGWILSSYLGTQSSVQNTPDGKTILNYSVTKYVDEEPTNNTNQ